MIRRALQKKSMRACAIDSEASSRQAQPLLTVKYKINGWDLRISLQNAAIGPAQSDPFQFNSHAFPFPWLAASDKHGGGAAAAR
jgi:hypothetical protein